MGVPLSFRAPIGRFQVVEISQLSKNEQIASVPRANQQHTSVALPMVLDTFVCRGVGIEIRNKATVLLNRTDISISVPIGL
jgi:hypothetical protein